MFKSYLKTSLNNIFQHKLYSLINGLGLTIGFTCFLMIGLFIRYELSVDQQHPNADRIYRLSMNFDGGETLWASNTYSFIPLLQENAPEIELASRFMTQQAVISNGANVFSEIDFRLVDPTFFELFSFDFIKGDSDNIFHNQFSLVITESMADKYFGSTDVLGKTLIINNEFPMAITAVISDLSDKTHLSGSFFTTFNAGTAIYGEQAIAGGRFDFHSYVKIKENEKIENYLEQYAALMESRLGQSYHNRITLEPVPLNKVYFTEMQNELPGDKGSMTQVYVFSLIAIATVIIGLINFVNLSTARSSVRAKEIAVRKSLGASRFQLICQFLAESMFLSFFAMLLAIASIEVLLPFFVSFIGKPIALEIASEVILVAALLLFSLFIGIIAGIYPAFYLSAFTPGKVIKNGITSSSKGKLSRQLLVVFQFSVSTALIISAGVIYWQMNYARNLELGFNKDRLVVISDTELGSQWESMKLELLSFSGITNVSASMIMPGTENTFNMPYWSGDGEQKKEYSLTTMGVDYDFFKTFDISLLEGRDFNKNIITDIVQFSPQGAPSGGAYIINNLAAREMGWSAEEAIGKSMSLFFENGDRGIVIGVVDDVYFESVKNSQKPIAYFISNTQVPIFAISDAVIKVEEGSVNDAIDYISNTWTRFNSEQPLSLRFLDQDFQSMYQVEEKQHQMLMLFSALAVVIASMGLHGLAAFNAERRIKEIGVRKVMGGSVWSIVLLLTNDFSKLVLLSNVIAWPIAYFAMNLWLETFAYRIDLTPLIFIGSGLIALCIAWVTVGGTAAKAASAKPVLALRYE